MQRRAEGRSVEQAAAELPANIQTIGHALEGEADARWFELLARTPVKRFVPLERMHHFGARWDGADFWRATFDLVELDA